MYHDRNELLADAKGRATTDPVKITVRELLAYWNAHRRTSAVIQRVQSGLADVGLRTDPPFEQVWISAPVALVSDHSLGTEDIPTPPVRLTVASLESANQAVVSVQRHESIDRARSLMVRWDYSQLPVLNGERTVVGAVTWESIAKATFANATPTLADATIDVTTVDLETDLLTFVPTIVERGFVLVIARDRRISGIVTIADLGVQFATLAAPFLQIGEIERHLRRKLDGTFCCEQLAAVRDPADNSRPVETASDLMFGEYARLFENDGTWSALNWDFDRTVFVEFLHSVREIRNDVMHFSPDPLETEQTRDLANFIKMLRTLDPHHA